MRALGALLVEVREQEDADEKNPEKGRMVRWGRNIREFWELFVPIDHPKASYFFLLVLQAALGFGSKAMEIVEERKKDREEENKTLRWVSACFLVVAVCAGIPLAIHRNMHVL
jgi:hypothetical protein